MHAYFCPLDFFLEPWVSSSVSRGLLERFFVPSLQGIAASIGISNFPVRFLNGFLELFVIRFDKVDACQLSRIVELRFIDSPWLLFLFVELLLTCATKFQGHKLSGLVVA